MSDSAPKQSSSGPQDPRSGPMAMFRSGLFTSLGVLAAAAAAAAVYTARDILIRALIALFLAISLDPAVRMLMRWRLRRGLAIVVVVLVALGLLAAFLQSVIPAMIDEFRALVRDFPHYVKDFQDRSVSLRRVTDRYHLTGQIQSGLGNLPGRLSSGLFGIPGHLFSALASTLTVVVLTIYFLVDLPRLQRSVVLLFPRVHRAKFSHIADVMVDKVGSYMIGNILISLVAGVSAFAALSALDVPLPVPLAFVVAVTDLIPLIGATLGAVICLVVAVLTTHVWPNAVLLAVFFVVYQQLENYLIAPRIMRRPVQLSPAAVLLAGLIGGSALGLVGALMAIPIAAGAKVLLSERLQLREEADTDPAAPDGETAPSPGHTQPRGGPPTDPKGP